MKLVVSILIFLGFFILVAYFWPFAKAEIKYGFDRASHIRYSLDTEVEGTFDKPLRVPNTDFSIAIPKIAAVATVVENVDPQNKDEYFKALRRGLAHAKGSARPGDDGNVFIFNCGRNNAVFYLIGKLQPADEIDIFYRDRLIKYAVYDKRTVSADSRQYFGTILPDEKTLTLQICYPPGTTFERLVVLAKQVE